MKIFKSFIVFGILTVMLLTQVLSSSTLEFNYETPIPLGAEFDLVDGLSQTQKAKAQADYIKLQTQREILENIHYNFVKSIDKDKYYGGAYWSGEAYLLNKQGEILKDEKGNSLLNDDRTLHILVTSLKIVPEEINNSKLIFEEVKYSEAELRKFRHIIIENFTHDGIISLGTCTEKNIIEITIAESYNFNIEQLDKFIPSDSYYVTFVED